MEVLHALWASGRLHLWIETSTFSAARTRRPETQGTAPHPAMVGHASLPEVLARLPGVSFSPDVRYESLKLSLPSGPKAPQASPELGGPDAAAEEMRFWKVETLSLNAADAFRFLSSPGEAPGLNFGASVLFWKEAAAFALGLIEKGCFAPAASGAWKPDLEESGFEARDLLAQGMPGLVLPSSGQVSRARLLSEFLEAMMTAFAKEEAPDFAPAPQTPENSSPPRWRLVFRLHAPETHDRPWFLEFGLQDTDDRGRVLTAREIWPSSGNKRELLLGGLGRASSVYPALSRGLDAPVPAGMDLTSREAYAFLRETALLLKAQGFGVLVPDFWHQKKNRLGMRLELKSSSASGKGTGLEALLDYDWQVLAGGQELTLEEFRALVELRMPLLKIRGAWVEIREQEIENALVFFQGRDKAPRRAMPVREALHAALEGDLSETGLPVVDVRAEGWIRHLLSASALEFPRVEIPEGFKGELRPYQHKGFSWLCFMREKNLGACLADDMGLGKTVQMITHFLREKNPAAGRRTVLIVCPMSIVRNWEKEIARFAPALGVAVHHGADRLTGAEFGKRASASDIVITTYGLVLRDQDLFSRLEWDLVVLDEAQNIKNDEARQTRAVKALRAKSRMALTGTPLENRLSELWSIMDFLNPGYLGLAAEFRTRFELPIENRRDAKKADTLKRLIGPFFLRRLKTDKSIIQDLPEKMEMKVYCNLTREQATLYAAAVQEMFAKAQNASGIQRKGIILAGLMKLKQVCNHPAQILRDKSALGERSGKLNRLRDMLEEVLAEGDKALVFTQFAEMGALLKPELEEKLRRRVLFLHGGSDAAEREEMIGLFQETQDYPIFILSTRAGGLGINLTAASHVFHYDRWWNPAVENQATDRAFRIGQTRNVQVHKFIAAGTLEEKIDDLLERKAALADKIMGGLEEFLTEIPIEELKEIVELGGGAVAE